MMKSGFPHLILGNKLVDAFLKCGSITDASKIFDEMPHRHIVTWNSMIASYIRHERSKEAISLYTRMVEEGVFPDEFTLSVVFKAFSDMGLLHGARIAHGRALVSGLDASNVFVASSLVDVYAKFGEMRDAHLVSDRIVGKDVVSFTALIVGYAQCGQDREALEVFTNMLKEGIKANEYTFSSILVTCGNLNLPINGKLIHNIIVKSGFESVIASQTSLLTMYSRCGLIDDSLEVFDGFLSPNQVTWTSLIVGLVQNGREETAFSKFRQMIIQSANPNSFTLSSVLRACSSIAMLEQGKQTHSIIMKFGLNRDKFTGAALIDFYGKCGIIQSAKLVFDRLSEFDAVPINSMIYSYAQNGCGYEAIELFHRMKDMVVEPNEVTIVSVLTACSNSGLIREGLQIFTSLKKKQNIELTRDHYACMVDLLARGGRLKEAEILIKQVKNPDVILWRTLLNACRIHGEIEMAKRATNRVLEIAPNDEGTHILLSNLYASTGDWSSVIGIKSTMREMKFKKNPAMSWIEVDRKIHTFMAGDDSNSRSKETHQMLERLIETVKKIGYVPDTRFVLQNMEEKEKEKSLYYHSEKLAIAFALCHTTDMASCIRLFKNLRVCGDCHSWIKYVSKAVGRDIVARDAKRFHHIRDGLCSCGDYW